LARLRWRGHPGGMWRAAFLLMLLPTLASAQDLVTTMRGLYGSATDPAGSCAVNPHQIDFLAQPPHLMMMWKAPWTDAKGVTQYDRRYDLLAVGDNTFTLRREDEDQTTDTGTRPIWILRHTTQPEGYCLGRTDWPQMRCEDQQLRCDAPVS
jgi:hypothetical protein